MNLRDLVFRRFWLKLFSVASGTVIWLAIHYNIDHDIALKETATGIMNVRRDIQVPILMMALDKESVLEAISTTGTNPAYKITPADAVVTVSGPPGVLDKDGGKIKVFVDLTDFHSKTPTREYLHADMPPDVYEHEIKPATVLVEPLKH